MSAHAATQKCEASADRCLALALARRLETEGETAEFLSKQNETNPNPPNCPSKVHLINTLRFVCLTKKN